MAKIEGASALYACGCTVSSDNGYRCVGRDGNAISGDRNKATEGYASKRTVLVTERQKTDREFKLATITEMVATKGGTKDLPEWTLPDYCGLHAEPTTQVGSWAYEETGEIREGLK